MADQSENLHVEKTTANQHDQHHEYLPRIALPYAMPSEPVAIADMANLFGVTHRTLHFYEEKGLLSASRVGLMRVYFHRDVVRMALINACREVGMPVAVIQDLLEELAAANSQEQTDEIFRDSLTVRKRELTSGLSIIRRQMQQINSLLAHDDSEPPTARADGRDTVSLNALERRCLELMAEGYAPMRIARALQLKHEEITVLENEIIRKFDANNRFQAVAKAVLMGVVAS
ncbi:MerR family transcriptional regulator [Rhizobium sp. CG5]|uniref:MerR family transcriptional regulator n=1 Tax=Rhizobium sp. CG5 TaxID=2726076 RepID=UPI0020342ECB|nr:MerR family transcriptional regulator [Rhizobium sp. CG5]MCM2472070.1 MerR family transcriptional regulator [Rhizobium sp. CG5]